MTKRLGRNVTLNQEAAENIPDLYPGSLRSER